MWLVSLKEVRARFCSLGSALHLPAAAFSIPPAFDLTDARCLQSSSSSQKETNLLGLTQLRASMLGLISLKEIFREWLERVHLCNASPNLCLAFAEHETCFALSTGSTTQQTTPWARLALPGFPFGLSQEYGGPRHFFGCSWATGPFCLCLACAGYASANYSYL